MLGGVLLLRRLFRMSVIFGGLFGGLFKPLQFGKFCLLGVFAMFSALFGGLFKPLQFREFFGGLFKPVWRVLFVRSVCNFWWALWGAFETTPVWRVCYVLTF